MPSVSTSYELVQLLTKDTGDKSSIFDIVLRVEFSRLELKLMPFSVSNFHTNDHLEHHLFDVLELFFRFADGLSRLQPITSNFRG